MEQHNNKEILELLTQPAFAVVDGRVVTCNTAARALLVKPGDALVPMLITGREAFQQLESGSLFVTMQVGGMRWGAAITRMEEFTLVLLDQEDAQGELQALALASRELRKPMMGLMNAASQLSQTQSPDVKELAAVMNHRLYQILRILGNMSDGAAKQSAQWAFLENRDLRAFLDEVLRKVKSLLEDAGLRLDIRWEIQGQLNCLIDAQSLERAVLNLLSNAGKYTPRGGVIQVLLTRSRNKLMLSVTDSGEGIAQEARSDLFSRYLRPAGLEDPRFGIGLGLLMVRGAAAIHGGTVLVDRPAAGGTRVSLTVALRKEPMPGVQCLPLQMDYAGEWDHALVELSEVLPAESFRFV